MEVTIRFHIRETTTVSGGFDLKLVALKSDDKVDAERIHTVTLRMTSLEPKTVMIVVLIMTVFGCGGITAEVESNTSWSGAFGNRTVDGSGDAVVELMGSRPQCAVVQKETEFGFLRLRINGGV